MRLIRDQVIMARGYMAIAAQHNDGALVRDLKSQLKDSQKALGEASSDTELHAK